nr:MAG TPA: hypothetical protein [Caudoviricetes sp.]
MKDETHICPYMIYRYLSFLHTPFDCGRLT